MLRSVTEADVRAAEERGRRAEPQKDYEFPAGPRHRFYGWRDEYGRLHEEIPRCCAGTRPPHRHSTTRDCRRKGIVKRRELVILAETRYFEPEHWYCLQHDPAKKDEKRLAELAPVLAELLHEGIEIMPPTKKAADWLRRVTAVLAKAEGR